MRALNAEQRGYLADLYHQLWYQGGNLPNDPEFLWRWAGATSRKRGGKKGAAIQARKRAQRDPNELPLYTGYTGIQAVQAVQAVHG